VILLGLHDSTREQTRLRVWSRVLPRQSLSRSSSSVKLPRSSAIFLCRCILPFSPLYAIVETVQLPRTQSVPLRYSRSCLLEIDTGFAPYFFGGLNSEQLSFWKRALHCFRSAHTEFSLISLLCRRKNLLRSCSFVKFFFGQLVVLVFSFRCQLPESTVFYSRLEVILHFFATVYLIGFCFRGTLHSVFYQFFIAS